MKNILIIHNDTSISSLIKMMLSSVNENFQVSNSYEDAKEIIKSKKVDLIVTDATVKGDFVFQYLEDLKKRASNIPIIVMSQVNQKTIVNAAKKIGINEFIPFPFTQKDVRDTVSYYL